MDQAISRPGSEKVYLAVGDDTEQCLLALQWALHFISPQMLLVLVHIHRPTTTFPTGLGASMQESRLSDYHVSEHRINARHAIEKNLLKCLQLCKVNAEILIIDKDDVVVALLELIKEHNISTLVMGAKKRKHDWKSTTAYALEKQADHQCNILYLQNGILVASRHGHTNVHTAGKSDIPSLGGCHFSGSSNSTTNKSSSFFNSCSTADTFDAEQLNGPSLVLNASYMYTDNRFSAIFGLESFVTFRQLVNQRNLAENSKNLYTSPKYPFKEKTYGDLCQLISGFDSPIGEDLQNLIEAHWKSIKSWPAVLEYIVSVLKTMQMQRLNDLSEAAKKPIGHLLTVASIVSDDGLRKSPEKIFCVLNMYTALMDATPILREVFCRESISTDVDGVLAKLKDSVRGIVKELKGLIQTYNSEKVVQDGGILLISEYLMRYISLLLKHNGTLDTILSHDHTGDLLTAEGTSLTSRLVFGLITDLESVINKHSKLFSSKGPQCIFLMNNMHFILQEVEQLDVGWTEKAEWSVNMSSLINGYIESYLSASWGPVISTLNVAEYKLPRKRARINFLKFSYTGPTPLQNFASSFSETCNTQMCWKVPNPALRDELRAKILDIVTQAYHRHLKSWEQSVGRNAKDFEPEWKIKISELLEG